MNVLEFGMSLADTLFSTSQRKLYQWIFGQPSRSYHLSELRRLSGLGSASLQRELASLTASGLVTATKVGNQRIFLANPASPVFRELTSIVNKTLGIEALLRDTLARLSSRIQSAWLYGSFAKGEDRAASDIDVMIVGDNLMLSEVLELLIPLESIVGRKINPTLFTVREFANRVAEPDSFVNRVFAGTVTPLIGGANVSSNT